MSRTQRQRPALAAAAPARYRVRREAGLLLLLLLFSAPQAFGSPDPYRGCLLFLDDARSPEDKALAESFGADFLLRSWYRFGEPPTDKSYALRGGLVAALKHGGIGLGGGGSLSVVTPEDLQTPAFQEAWLARDLDGTVHQEDGRSYGSLSHPGFRAYLVSKAVAQARLGVTELHFGETNGKILYDDWSLGLQGDDGFIQWLKRTRKANASGWWNKPVTRETLASLSKAEKTDFQRAWGADEWKGCDDRGRPAFRAYLYRRNLGHFLSELREALAREGLKGVVLDVWGFAPWMTSLDVKPDAFLSSPPDERWGFRWNTDPAYPLARERERIKKVMVEDVRSVSPVPVIYLFDHPQPFQTDFVRLPDARQAALTRFFAALADEVGAGFALRSYSLEKDALGPQTRKVITEECLRRKTARGSGAKDP